MEKCLKIIKISFKSIYLYFSLVSIKKGGDIYSRRRIESILGGE